MTCDMSKDNIDLITKSLESFGIPCTDSQAKVLLEHLGLVIEKNKVLNLTRITNPSEALFLHIVDSLLPLACDSVSLCSSDRFCDIGTGAGFPGIPLAIVSGAEGVLIDSVGKKVNAVNEFINELKIEHVNALHLRAEELAVQQCHSFDYVFARAVAQSNTLLEYASPLLKQGGLVVLEKAQPSMDELQAAYNASKLLGFSFVSRETFELPNNLGHREILMYRKNSMEKIRLPRRNGLAKLEPLGIYTKQN